MRTMNRRTLYVLAGAVMLVASAACGSHTPTGPSSTPEAAQPGGGGFGSGNFQGNDPAFNAIAPEGFGAADPVQADRGGVTFGSGN